MTAVLSACSAGGTRRVGSSPEAVSASGFKRLGWLEGSWVGKEPDGKPFYEEYRFKDDSTMGTWSFRDSAATSPNDSGEIRLRGGRVTSGNDLVSWVVTSLDNGRIEFAPLRGGVHNSFSWTRGSDGGWVASLHWPADGTRPARDVEYHMEKFAR
jgi:hypothetical protein